MARICTHAADIDTGIDLIAQHEVKRGLGVDFILTGQREDLRRIEIAENRTVTAAGQVHIKNMPDDGGPDRIQLVMLVFVDTITKRHVPAEILAITGQVLVRHDDAVAVLLPLQLCEAGQKV